MGYLAGIGECSLAAGEQKGHCKWCGAELTGRQQRWCSDACARDGYLANHVWTSARSAALERATVYRIRRNPAAPSSGMVPEPLDLDHRGEPTGRPLCVMCEERTGSEVDHIEAANGQHGRKSCIHHQDNLRVLCEPCHRRRTADQARERAAHRRRQGVLL